MAYPVDAGITTMSGKYIPELWSGVLLDKFYAATVFGEISNTKYEGEISAVGDKVTIRTIPDFTVSDYSIGMTLASERPDTTIVELLIDKGKYFNLSINRVEEKQADIDYVNKWADHGSQQMKVSIDSSVLAGIYADVAAANKGATAGAISGNIDLGATTAPITLTKVNIIDKICELGQVLDEQNAPETDRWLTIPAWAATRLKTSDLKDASLTGDGKSPLRNGRIGMIDRFMVYVSNQLPHVTDTTECFHLLAGHKSSLTFATQLTENEIIPNPNDFGKLMRGLQVYGFKVVLPTMMADLYATAG